MIFQGRSGSLTTMTDTVPASAPERSQTVTPFQVSDHLPFYKIAQTRAHDIVIDQIVLGIRAGIILPGDQLPTIEALAELTGVSKPVVGEAVRVLREHGLVATKRGVSGGITILRDEIPPELLRGMSEWRNATLTELVEARRPVEEELALLAGERGTVHDFAAMRDSIRLLREELEGGTSGGFLRYDHRFHYQIGLAARSEMLAFYQHRVLSESAATLHEYNLYHEIPELVINTHEAILEAIEKRDPEAIRKAADWHWRTSSGAFSGVEDIDLTGPR